MNGKEAFFAMALGDVVKREVEHFTQYFFDAPFIDDAFMLPDLDIKSVWIYHPHAPAYNVNKRHFPIFYSEHEDPFGSGPIYRQITRFNPRIFRRDRGVPHQGSFRRISDRSDRNACRWDTRVRACRSEESLDQ